MTGEAYGFYFNIPLVFFKKITFRARSVLSFFWGLSSKGKKGKTLLAQVPGISRESVVTDRAGSGAHMLPLKCCFPFPSLGWAFLGIFVSGTNVSGSPRLIASSQVMIPAITSASFLLLPGKGPGNHLLSWMSLESHPHSWAGHALSGQVWIPAFTSAEPTKGEGVPRGMLGRQKSQEKRGKEGREGGREEGKRKGNTKLLQTPTSLVIRCLTPALGSAESRLLSTTFFLVFSTYIPTSV